MKKQSYFPVLLIWTILVLVAFPAHGQDRQDIEGDRLAQTGMKFLTRSVDPRAAAMASAVTASSGSSMAMFYNPAGMASMDNSIHATASQVQWIAGHEYNTGSIALRPADGMYGTIGVSLMAVSYGEFVETIRADNESGYRDVGNFSPSAMALGLGYARRLSDRFSLGAHVKYARQSLGSTTMSLDENQDPVRSDNTVSTPAVDFGVIYRTGFRSLVFAWSVRNFSSESTYYEESFELPLTFNIGVSMDMLDFTQLDQNMHSLLLSVDGRRPRDFNEQIKAGLEYTFMDLLSLRAGYLFPSDEQGIHLGGGIQTSLSGIDLSADYAYTQFGVFGSVNRIGVQVGL